MALLRGKTRQARVSAAIGVWLILAATIAHPACADENRDLLTLIGDAYRANQSAFKFGKCQFIYTTGYADSEQDAVDGKWNDRRKPIVKRAEIYWQDDTFCFRQSREGVQLNVKKDSPVPPTTAVDILKKGNYAIDHDALAGNAIVYSPENFALIIRYQPFNLSSDIDVDNPGAAIEFAQRTNFDGTEITVQRNVQRDGRDFIRLKKSSTADSHDTHFYVDPQRGHLAFITETFYKGSDRLFKRMLLLDVHRESGAFFPMRAVTIAPSDPQDGPAFVRVREMKVTSLDLAYHPTKEDFTIQFPKYTQFWDGLNPNTSKSIFRDRKDNVASISADEIKPLYESLQSLAVNRQERQTKAAEAKSSARRVSFVAVVVNVLVIAALFTAYLMKRRSASRAA